MQISRMLRRVSFGVKIGGDAGGGRYRPQGGEMGGGGNDPEEGTDGGGKCIRSGATPSIN